jgi:hypothetical protein
MDSGKIIFIKKISFDMESLHGHRHGESRISSYLLAADLSIKAKLAMFESDEFMKSKAKREVAKTD